MGPQGDGRHGFPSGSSPGSLPSALTNKITKLPVHVLGSVDEIHKTTDKKSVLTFCDAAKERISGVSGGAAAYRVVIDDLAIGVQTAGAWTGIPAPLFDASRVLRAICAGYALWSTLRWTADVILLTGADCVVVNDSTVTVRSAG